MEILKPRLIIVMGISGSGKSTVAQLLADELNFCFLDADDFHSETAKNLMASGRPLSDDMRLLWIERMSEYLRQHRKNSILAFSGLRKKHRQAFRELEFQTQFLHLVLSPKIIEQRLRQRRDHFFPASLLNSQLNDLESSTSENDLKEIDGAQTIKECVAQCLSHV